MQTKKDRTREHILKAAYPLFAARGFKNMTMTDICKAADISRGGLYSHFGSTRELFEALLTFITQKDAMDFDSEIAAGIPAKEILNRALELMEEEMAAPEDSLSLAMFEYAADTQSGSMPEFMRINEAKWTALIRYGIARGEFRTLPTEEIVPVILYAYQGIRLFSLIIPMQRETHRAILSHIRHQLIEE